MRASRAPAPTRVLVRMALLVAVCAALGYALAGAPMELISAAVCTSGVLLGVRRGAVVGALAEAIFAGFNPVGVSPPPLFVTQVLSFAGFGALGGVVRPLVVRGPTPLRVAAAALVGFVATIAYDAATGVAVWATLRDQASLMALVIGSLTFPFPLAHALGNAIAFAVVVPAVARVVPPGWAR
jgi:hypothetical protein